LLSIGNDGVAGAWLAMVVLEWLGFGYNYSSYEWVEYTGVIGLKDEGL
jgi:hypothetical protein